QRDQDLVTGPAWPPAPVPAPPALSPETVRERLAAPKIWDALGFRPEDAKELARWRRSLSAADARRVAEASAKVRALPGQRLGPALLAQRCWRGGRGPRRGPGGAGGGGAPGRGGGGGAAGGVAPGRGGRRGARRGRAGGCGPAPGRGAARHRAPRSSAAPSRS